MATDGVEHRRESLPPGQRARDDFPRFGLPAFAARWPQVPASTALRIGGDVDEPFELAVSELASLPRDEQVSDFHCVTTWSKLALRWGGVRLRDVYEQLVVPRARPHTSCRYLVIRGLDGYRISVSLEDALQPDVMLADRLDGRSLPLEFCCFVKAGATDGQSRTRAGFCFWRPAGTSASTERPASMLVRAWEPSSPAWPCGPARSSARAGWGS